MTDKLYICPRSLECNSKGNCNHVKPHVHNKTSCDLSGGMCVPCIKYEEQNEDDTVIMYNYAVTLLTKTREDRIKVIDSIRSIKFTECDTIVTLNDGTQVIYPSKIVKSIHVEVIPG
jgi:hypothetical protein